MGCQLVDVHHVIVADESVALLVVSFPAHVGIHGIAGIEESVTDAVGIAQSRTQARQSRHFQFTCITVVSIFVGNGSRRFELPEFGIVHRLHIVAHAARSQQTHLLASDLEIASPGQVAAENGQRSLLRNREIRIENFLCFHIFPEFGQT